MNGGEHNEDEDDEGWEYGDAWKHGSPDDKNGPDEPLLVEVLRGDSGQGYDDTLMLDLIGYLGSRGIRATYESFSIGLEPAAIKTYVLKVEAGREADAVAVLREHEAFGGSS